MKKFLTLYKFKMNTLSVKDTLKEKHKDEKMTYMELIEENKLLKEQLENLRLKEKLKFDKQRDKISILQPPNVEISDNPITHEFVNSLGFENVEDFNSDGIITTEFVDSLGTVDAGQTNLDTNSWKFSLE